MSRNFIPDDLAQFILNKIDSVARLEALLLLRSNPEQEWSIKGLAERLYISERETAEIVRSLCAQRIFLALPTEPARFRYQPGSRTLQLLVDRLAEVYSTHLVPVTNLIHSKPADRIQEFAEAFKLRKDE